MTDTVYGSPFIAALAAKREASMTDEQKSMRAERIAFGIEIRKAVAQGHPVGSLNTVSRFTSVGDRTAGLKPSQFGPCGGRIR